MGNDKLISVHRWKGSRVFSVVRQHVINALAAAAARAGVEIVTNSVAAGASADGMLLLADGRTLKADLVVGADGSNSRLRDSPGLLAKRKYLVDGCTRLLMGRPMPSARKSTAPRPSSIGRAHAACSTRRAARPTSISR